MSGNKFVCECGKTLAKSSRAKHLKSKTHINKMNGVVREVCKSIQEKNNKVLCECGCYYTKKHKARHQKSKKHFDCLKKINNKNHPAYKNSIKILEDIAVKGGDKELEKLWTNLQEQMIQLGVDDVPDDDFKYAFKEYYDFVALSVC